MGYAGGTTPNPTYSNIGDYSETVKVDFDPAVISYEQLLAAFWSGHDASYPPYSTQYRSAIFYTSTRQQELATSYKDAEEVKSGKTLYTDIEPYTGFYVAEDYHQKYYLRQKTDIVNSLYEIYPDTVDFRESTAAARLNGYVAGYGDAVTLQENLDSLGLTEKGKEALLQATRFGLTPGCPAIIR